MKDFRKFNRKLEIVESLGGYRLPNICEQQAGCASYNRASRKQSWS